VLQCALTALPGQHVDEDGEEPGPADPGHLHPQAVQVGNCTQEQAGAAHPVRATGRAQQDKEASQAKKVLRREAVEHKQFLDTLFIAVRFFGKRFPRQVVANPHRAEVNAPWRGAEEE
jgi:hypothetical protein